MRYKGSVRVGKKSWYALGGFTEWRCWRRFRNGAWQYFLSEKFADKMSHER